MSRAILLAPLARDLAAEYPLRSLYRIPNASNGVRQAWCTNDREFFQALGDPELAGYARRDQVPNGLRAYCIVVLRSDARAASTNPYHKQLAMCGAGDFFRVRASDGAISVKLRSELIAGDRPVDWLPVHHWLGVDDTLGED